MRVGLLHHDLNKSGGREQVAISIMKCLKKHGLKTLLICGEKVDDLEITQNFGVSLRSHKQLIIPFWHTQPKIETYQKFFFPLAAKPFCDIIINPYTNDLLPLVDVTYIHYPQPLIIANEYEKTKSLACYYKLYQSIQRSFSSRIAHKLVIANSFLTADAVKKQCNVKPIVLYPPVDLMPLKHKSKGARENIILTISRFTPEKRLESIPLIAKKVNAMFIIMGRIHSKQTYNKIRDLIKKYDVEKRVTLITDASFNQKNELLRSAKVYFHTMPFEHFGISIVEAMGAGCIPVVHDSGGPREFVPSDLRYRDEEEAIQKIQCALDSWSPTIAEDMITIAWRYRKERFQNEFWATLNSYLCE